MKKKLCVLILFLFGISFGVNGQQKIKVDLYGGVATTDDFTFNIGIDAYYMFQLNETINLGLYAGYSHFYSDFLGVLEVFGADLKDFSFMPIASSLQFVFWDHVLCATDAGYAIGLGGDQNDGGFYYQGKLGWTMPKFEAFVYYKAIEHEVKAASAGIGIAYVFNLKKRVSK